jgi:hypothetical protein
MTDGIEPTPRKLPKGGRKGGTIFPKINLQRALEYGKKLVAKTHTGAQPEDEILPGVFGNSGSDGKIRGSALKQFGLMQGDPKGYEATPLAKEIDAALPEGRPPLLKRAFLASKVFEKLFDTFHGDTISKAQVAKRAKELEVHPESADECAQLFIDSAITAELATMSGDSIALVKAVAETVGASGEDDDADEPAGKETETAKQSAAVSVPRSNAPLPNPDGATHSGKPGLAVSINVDSSSDPDKLEKQLKLLREFGVI